MEIGDLIKHLTQDKWGIIIEIADYLPYAGMYYNILWSDEPDPFWVWDDIIKKCNDERG